MSEEGSIAPRRVDVAEVPKADITSYAFTARAPAEEARCGSKGHEVLTREPAPVLIGSRWLLRAGSGAG